MIKRFAGIALAALIILLAAQAALAADTFTLIVGGQAASGTYEVERGRQLFIDVSGEGIWKDVTVDTVVWKSSDESVAYVQLGVVYAQKVGTTRITATALNGVQSTSRSLTVKVIKSSTSTIVSLRSAGGVTTLDVGDTLQLIADVSPEGTKLAWKSGAPAVASVDDSGLVTARKGGKVTITVTAQDGSEESASLTLTVKAAASTISLNRKTATLYVGGVTKKFRTSTQLTATVKPSGAAGAVTWSSSNSAVASVNAKGKVAAHKAGKAVITASASGGKQASCAVTVQKLPTKVQLPPNKQVKAGKRLNMASLMKIDGTITSVKWKSSNKKIAKVSAAGVVLGVRPGNAKIAVKTVNGKTDVCLLRVVK